MALIEIKNLTFTYNGAEEPALSDINLTVESGDFVLLFGESGCGKTTLLRLIKKQLRPSGTQEGEILFNGQPVENMDERASVSEIGYVMQDPENQTVTDKVWHELAFGLESLGEKTDVILSSTRRARVPSPQDTYSPWRNPCSVRAERIVVRTKRR